MLAELESDGRIWFTSSYAERSLVRSLPGSTYDRATERWCCRATWAACLTMRSLFGPALQLGPRLVDWARERAAVEQTAIELGNSLELDEEGYQYDSRLFGYQKAGAEFLSFTGNAILGDEPGLGKTAQAISTLKAMHDQCADIFPVLIVCPNSLKRTWQDEFKLWWPDGPGVEVVSGSANQRRKKLQSGAQVHAMNWESIRLHSKVAGYGSIRLKACAKCGGVEEPRPGEEYKGAVTEAKCEVHPREIQANGYRTVIVDEAHRMKDPNAKQTRAVWSALHSAEYKFLLTGTPVADNVGDLWSLLHGIDKDSFPVKSKFLDVFAQTQLNFFGGYEVLGLNPERAGTFHRVLSSYLRRTPKALALPQLPPKLPVQYRYAEMNPKQAKQYNQMRDGMLTLLDSGEPITAADQLAQFTRLRQFACATGTKGEDGKVKLTDPSCKVDDLLEFVQDNPGKPLVVAAEYKQIIMLAYARLTDHGYKCGLITGDQTLDERHVTCKEFQAGRLDVALLTMQAGGEGITLTAADTMYFLERSSSLLRNKQTEDRVYRIGSEIHDAVRIVVSISAGTIEDNREWQLAMKEDRFEEIVMDRERAKRMLRNE